MDQYSQGGPLDDQTSSREAIRSKKAWIERPAERRTLESLDVPLAQGFHLAMPGEPWPEVEGGALGEGDQDFAISGPTRGASLTDR